MESTLKFQRGDIYFVRLDNRTGSEQSGTRPAVILQNDVGNSCSPTLIVATLTSKTEKKATQPTHCLVEPEGLEPSIVQAEQIFTIDKSRVKRFVGHLTPEEMGRVDDAVKISLALNPMGSIQKLKPIIRSTAAYAPPEVVDGKPPVYPYTPIKSDFEDAGTVEEMMLRSGIFHAHPEHQAKIPPLLPTRSSCNNLAIFPCWLSPSARCPLPCRSRHCIPRGVASSLLLASLFTSL